jgi:hypothetical protein
MNKYEIIYPDQINDFVKKGYEFVTVFYESSYNSGGHTTQSANIRGMIGLNSVDLNFNLPVPSQGQSSGTPKFLMCLTPQAETLYGEHQNENKF